jgi:hypothetical protein
MKIFGNKNAKLVFTGKQNNCHIVTFNLPPLKTCPRAGACKAFCYGQVGNYCFTNMKDHMQRNFELSKSNNFVDLVLKDLANLRKKHKKIYVRLHDVGDFYTATYAAKWATIARAFPDIVFYAYSKSWKMLESVDLPGNIVILPSLGGKDDKLIGYRSHVAVRPVGTDVPKRYVNGSKDDLVNLFNCLNGRSISIEAHGAKKGKV